VKNFYKQNYVGVNSAVAALAAVFAAQQYGQYQHNAAYDVGFHDGVNQYLQL
jgi:hypothetical protein